MQRNLPCLGAARNIVAIAGEDAVDCFQIFFANRRIGGGEHEFGGTHEAGGRQAVGVVRPMCRSVVQFDVRWRGTEGIATVPTKPVKIMIGVNDDGLQPFFGGALVEEAEEIVVVMGDAAAIFVGLESWKRLCDAVQKAFRKFLVRRLLGDIVHEDDWIEGLPRRMVVALRVGMPPFVSFTNDGIQPAVSKHGQGALETVFIDGRRRKRIALHVVRDGGGHGVVVVTDGNCRFQFHGSVFINRNGVIDAEVIFNPFLPRAGRPKGEQMRIGMELTVGRIENGRGKLVVFP